jgi:hypothetical protein
VARTLKNDLYDDLRDLADASDKIAFAACVEKLNFFFKKSDYANACSLFFKTNLNTSLLHDIYGTYLFTKRSVQIGQKSSRSAFALTSTSLQ